MCERAGEQGGGHKPRPLPKGKSIDGKCCKKGTFVRRQDVFHMI